MKRSSLEKPSILTDGRCENTFLILKNLMKKCNSRCKNIFIN